MATKKEMEKTIKILRGELKAANDNARMLFEKANIFDEIKAELDKKAKLVSWYIEENTRLVNTLRHSQDKVKAQQIAIEERDELIQGLESSLEAFRQNENEMATKIIEQEGIIEALNHALHLMFEKQRVN